MEYAISILPQMWVRRTQYDKNIFPRYSAGATAGRSLCH